MTELIHRNYGVIIVCIHWLSSNRKWIQIQCLLKDRVIKICNLKLSYIWLKFYSNCFVSEPTKHLFSWCLSLILYRIVSAWYNKTLTSPGWVAQLVRALSWYARVSGSIPGQGTCKTQPVGVWVGGMARWCFSLSLSLPPFPSSLLYPLSSK